MAATLTFDTGLRTYEVNGGETISFNPTDTGFIERFMSTIERLRETWDEFEKGMAEHTGAVEAALDSEGDVGEASHGLTAFVRSHSDRMRGEFDALLGPGTAAKLFPGDMSLCSLAGGWPVWVNAVEALSVLITDELDAEGGRTDARASAYSERYEAMMRKYRRR